MAKASLLFWSGLLAQDSLLVLAQLATLRVVPAILARPQAQLATLRVLFVILARPQVRLATLRVAFVILVRPLVRLATLLVAFVMVFLPPVQLATLQVCSGPVVRLVSCWWPLLLAKLLALAATNS
jgi:hypothetical protein